MSKISMNRLVAVVSLAAMSGFLPVLPAHAADKPAAHAVKPTAEDMIEEVVVTARRREESLQSVPIAVTVMSGEQLAKQGVVTVWDLAAHVPSLSMASQGNMTKSFQANLRAMRVSSFLIQDDPSVGAYWAEAPVAHPWGFGDNFYDIQGVQVLKGPQGTLFGRNTTGGAILIEPNKASIEEGFGGDLKLAIGNYNMEQFDGTVNIPLNDVAAIRVAGEHKKRDGYTKNIMTGQKRDGVGNDALRVSILLKPTKNITSHTILDYLREDASPSSAEITQVFGPHGTSNGLGLSRDQLYAILAQQQSRSPYDVAMISGTNGVFDQHSPLKCQPGNPLYIPGHICRIHMMPREWLSNFGFLNNTAVDFEGITAKNIIAFRRMQHFNEDSATFPFASPITVVGNAANSAAGGAAGGTAFQQNRNAEFSEEFQMQGKAFDQMLDWVTGVFYMREWGSEYSPSYTNSQAFSNSTGTALNLAKGLFAQGTYKVSDRLKATVGVRRNYDERTIDDLSFGQQSYAAGAAAVPATGTPAKVAGGVYCQTFHTSSATTSGLALDTYPNCDMNLTRSFSSTTWNMALDYQLYDQTLVYGSASRGYKAGGFSLRAHTPGSAFYKPEFVTNFEAGIKSDWSLFDRPIRTNVAIYRMNYLNQQFQLSRPGVPVLTVVDNIGKSTIKGIELEATYKATRRLEISGFYSYIDPKYDQWNIQSTPAVGLVDVSYRPFAYTNKVSAGLSVSYNLPLDSSLGDVTVRADASAQSKWPVDQRVAGDLTSNPVTGVTGYTMVTMAGYALLNLRADWKHVMGHPVDLGFFVNNAGNKAYFMGGSGLNGFVTQPIAPPRMFGLELSYRFGEGFKPKE